MSAKKILNYEYSSSNQTKTTPVLFYNYTYYLSAYQISEITRYDFEKISSTIEQIFDETKNSKETKELYGVIVEPEKNSQQYGWNETIIYEVVRRLNITDRSSSFESWASSKRQDSLEPLYRSAFVAVLILVPLLSAPYFVLSALSGIFLSVTVFFVLEKFYLYLLANIIAMAWLYIKQANIPLIGMVAFFFTSMILSFSARPVKTFLPGKHSIKHGYARIREDCFTIFNRLQ